MHDMTFKIGVLFAQDDNVGPTDKDAREDNAHCVGIY